MRFSTTTIITFLIASVTALPAGGNRDPGAAVNSMDSPTGHSAHVEVPPADSSAPQNPSNTPPVDDYFPGGFAINTRKQTRDGYRNTPRVEGYFPGGFVFNTGEQNGHQNGHGNGYTPPTQHHQDPSFARTIAHMRPKYSKRPTGPDSSIVTRLDVPPMTPEETESPAGSSSLQRSPSIRGRRGRSSSEPPRALGNVRSSSAPPAFTYSDTPRARPAPAGTPPPFPVPKVWEPKTQPSGAPAQAP